MKCLTWVFKKLEGDLPWLSWGGSEKDPLWDMWDKTEFVDNDIIQFIKNNFGK